ncbi:MAG: twin-arginine translocation pathway signal protein, partial [Pseudomonadota bacterium]
PLGPDLAAIDYAAYMSSIEHLQETFTRSTGWPNADLDMDDAMKDMETEAGRFERRDSFAYAVLSPDGARERGCIYVYPGVGEHDAVVRLWVTKAEFDAGFDEELYAWTQDWIAQDWPFENVAYPGRAIAWEEWDALTTES